MLSALLRQRRRLLLATIAIALSVGYLAGALNLLDRVGQGLDALSSSSSASADLVIEGGIAYESPTEQVRRLVPSIIEQSIGDIGGVAVVSPRIEDTAPLVGPDGKTLVPLGLTEQPIGANYPADDRLSPFRFVKGGPPTDSSHVAIDERSATAGGVGVGDHVIVVGRAGAAPYTVSGIVGTSGGGLPPGSSLALLTTPEARVRFDRPTDDNTIDVLLEPGADRAHVQAQIAQRLPAGIDVVDGATGAQHRQDSLDRSFALVRALILGFAGLALIVGMVTVGNSLALLYAERRRTFAGLRLVGAKPWQLLSVALIEAALLALVASLLGAPLGLLLGRLIEAALGALNTSVPVAGSPVSISALAWAVVIGTVATVVAAVVPAARACRVPPIEAVTHGGAPRPRPALQSLVRSGLVAVVLGLAAALLGSRGEAGISPLALGLGVAVIVVLIGLTPLLLAGLVAGFVRVLPLRPPALRTIAARDVGRHRARTAATAAALILATAVVAGLAVFLSSFSKSIDGQVRDLVAADLVVDSGTFTKGGLAEDLVGRIGALPSVSAVSGWQVGRGWVNQQPVRMTGFDMATFSELLHPGWQGEAPATMSPGDVVVSSRLADALGISVGSTLPVMFTSTGSESLHVAGIYTSGDLLLGDLALDRSVLTRQVPATTDIAALVSLSPNEAAARAAVRDVARQSGVSSVLKPAAFVDRRSEVLTGFQRVVEWMLLFTLVQALIGVVNTLLLSVGERRREFGLLRASGASRRQVMRMVLGEGVALAVIGTLVGLLLGVIGARLGVASLASLGVTTFSVPIGGVMLVAVAASVLGIAATVAPARWASGVPPLEAVFDDGDLRSRPRRAQRPRLLRFGRAGFHWTGDADLITDLLDEPLPGAGWVVPPPLPANMAAPSSPGAQLPVLAKPERLPRVAPLPLPLPLPLPEPEPEPEQPVVPPAWSAPVAESVPQTDAETTPTREPARVRWSPRRSPGSARPDSAPDQAWTIPEAHSAAGARPESRFGVGSPSPSGREAGTPTPDASTGPFSRSEPRSGTPDDPRSGSRLGPALGRLDPRSASEAAGALRVAASSLAGGERVERLVVGRAKGLACVVARTDRRLLVVADRAGRPLVESLRPDRTMVGVQRSPDATVTLVVSDGRRVMRLQQVRETVEAELLAGSSGTGPAYF